MLAILPISAMVAQTLGQILRETAQFGFQSLRTRRDHGLVNCWKLFEFARSPTFSLTPPETVAYCLGQEALLLHTKYLKDVDSPNYSGLDTKNVWAQNPLGALLSVAILLAEIPARICWHSHEIDLSVDEWDASVNSFMPADRLILSLKPSEAVLFFERDPSEYPAGVDPHDKPISKPRLAILKKALGPECMGLLSAEQATNLRTEWKEIEPLPDGDWETEEMVAHDEKPVDVSRELRVRLDGLEEWEEAAQQVKGVYMNLREQGEWRIAAEVMAKCEELSNRLEVVRENVSSFTDKEWAEQNRELEELGRRVWSIIPESMHMFAPILERLIKPYNAL